MVERWSIYWFTETNVVKLENVVDQDIESTNCKNHMSLFHEAVHEILQPPIGSGSTSFREEREG